MRSLNNLLKRYARVAASIRGGADELQQPAIPAAAPSSGLNKDEFRRDLDGLLRTNTVSIGLVAFVIVAAFVLTLLMIRQYAGNASAVATLFVGFGALSTGLTTAIFGMFRVKAQSDMLRILSRNLDAASLQTVIDVLAKRT